MSIGGLEAVPTLNWSNPNRILIHVCDAPCHGTDYYDKKKQSLVARNKWDLYPGGDPKKRDVDKLLLSIKRQNIQYFSIQLNQYTAKMFEEFQIIYGLIPELDVKSPADLINSVSKITSTTIMTSIDNTMSVFKTTEQRKSYTLIDAEPNWKAMNIYSIEIFEYMTPTTIEQILRPLFIGSFYGRMQIATRPFAEGSLRYAYYGKFSDDSSEMIDVVYKELISADPKYNTLAVYKQHLEIHVIAKLLAELFNEAQRKIFRKPVEIFYADASIVQQRQDPSKIYQVEARLNQKIQKWNNNSGGVNFENYSTILQAFSHWTYDQTGGRMMVVDLQGVKASDDNKYLLTDPAIHFDDLKRFRESRTNLGVKGMKKFFDTHICSEVCEKLELKKVANDIDKSIAKHFHKSSEMFAIAEDAENN